MIANATKRVEKHSRALATASLPASGSQRHTRGLQAAKKTQARARSDFEKLVGVSLDLVDSGSGKIAVSNKDGQAS
jgi:hypothetical protein